MLSHFKMLSQHISKKKKKKKECTCISVKVDDRRHGDQDGQPVCVGCSSPGVCVADKNEIGTKRESVTQCADIPLKSLGETLFAQKEHESADSKKSSIKSCENKLSGMSCNRKIHYYKVDLNNSEDTGLETDKQCQTCGPECSPATCSSRSREYFISWDKIRTKIFLFLALAFILWLSIYSSLSLTSNL